MRAVIEKIREVIHAINDGRRHDEALVMKVDPQAHSGVTKLRKRFRLGGMCYRLPVLSALLFSWFTFSAAGFNGHQVTEGPVTLAIGEIPVVREVDVSQTIRVSLTNTANSALQLKLSLTGLAEPCRAIGGAARDLDLPAHGASEATFQIMVGKGAWSALYPVHVLAEFNEPGSRAVRVAHAIRIFETQLAAVPAAAVEGEIIDLPPGGSLALAGLKACRPSWRLEGKELHYLPVGWQGSDPESLAFFQRGFMARGQSRLSLNVHPPYKTGTGPLFLEYRLRLPSKGPVVLRFFNAIRDVSAPEPPSDGVTFRVWVGEEKVFERHTAATTWEPGEADLSRWAGQTVNLRLESHPGPRLDPTCDSAFWGDPVVLVGEPPITLSPEQAKERLTKARAAVASGKEGAGLYVFELGQGLRAALVPGPNGVADAILAFGSEKGAVAVKGFTMALEDQNLGAWESGVRLEKLETERSGRELVLRHHLRLQREFDRDGRRIPRKSAVVTLTARFRVDQPGLRVKFTTDARLTDLALGPADTLADRVYYGHGYVIEHPGKFRAGAGGHNLATSHVGCDFAGGVSLLQACDTPPDYFLVDPDARLYALHTHPDATLTFVASHENALDCALKYRPLYDKQPAAAVAKKSGRFVFDIWGGSYAGDSRLLNRCFDYGLTNSLVMMHDWQRWGYDYRLPDIFPPQPGLGTTEDLRELGQACGKVGALWGLHDNYIDIYPDATGFGYDSVTFDAEGRPNRAWLNEGRNAQSYQFRPDKVKPYLERNLKLIEPALKPTASFVDVWTSINAFDYFDYQGRWHSKTETLRCWGEGFDKIRRMFDSGPTVSEAGSDQLIGWLDGADCQFMRLTSKGGRFSNMVPCADWEQVPWFDAVNHTRFSLHGVGYSDRYQSGRSREMHGIESDDYLSAEILTGHALMIDLPAMPRGAVRKYWLAQRFVEKVARDEIAAVRNIEGDLHRLMVTWSSGARSWVNRSQHDWVVEGRVLPPYGYLAKANGLESSIERIAGRVVERSGAENEAYVNARGFQPETLGISLEAERVEHLGARDFRLVVHWRATQPAPRELAVFYHFNRTTPGRYTDTEFYGGGAPALPTTSWKGNIVTGTNWVIHFPEGYPLGDYEILCGLYDARGKGTRYRLVGDEREHRRYRLGILRVEGEISDNQTNISKISFAPAPGPVVAARMPEPPARIDFGSIQTTGGLKVSRRPDHLLLVPLPEQDPFEVTFDISQLAGATAKASKFTAVTASGTVVRQVPYDQGSGKITFTTQSEDFGYRLDLR